MSTDKPIRVLIVDDHLMVRYGLKTLLGIFQDLAYVGEAANGEEAVRLCDALHPDVVLMDLMLPGMSGEETISVLRRKDPHIQVLALTSFVEVERAHAAVRAGAIGYLLKNISGSDLAQAIHAAHAGRTTIAPEMAQALLAAAGAAPHLELTERERAVLALMVEGLTNAEIATRLVTSVPTARFHVSNILAKLDVNNRTEAVHRARQYKLIP